MGRYVKTTSFTTSDRKLDRRDVEVEMPLVQEQEQSLGGVQIEEEVQVTEFSLLASLQDLENNGEDPVTFTSLCPLSSTRCMKAATTFQGLLKLERAGKVVSTQEENFAEIIVSIV